MRIFAWIGPQENMRYGMPAGIWSGPTWTGQAVLIDTIAMIGSPASRGAVASVGGAGRACFAAAPVLSAASAASVTTAEAPQRRRIAPVDCAVVSRSTMPCPG